MISQGLDQCRCVGEPFNSHDVLLPAQARHPLHPSTPAIPSPLHPPGQHHTLLTPASTPHPNPIAPPPPPACPTSWYPRDVLPPGPGS